MKPQAAQPVSFATQDGYQLHGLLFSPAEAPKSTVQINSGTGIPKEFYSKLANYLCDEGYQVLTYDYRGIGGSRPPQLKGFVTKLTDWGSLDMPAATDYLRALQPELPLMLIGHSLGGQLSGLMPNHQEITAAVFLNSSVGSWRLMPAPYKYFTAFIWYIMVPLCRWWPGYLPSKRLGLGEDLPIGVASQWARWCKHNAYFVPYMQEPDFPRQYFDQVSFPIWSLIAEDDPIANTRTTPPLLALYHNAPIQSETLSLQQTQQKAIGHLGFLRTAASSYLWPEIVRWLDKQAQT